MNTIKTKKEYRRLKKLINNTISIFGLKDYIKVSTKQDFYNKSIKELFRINLLKKNINNNNNKLSTMNNFQTVILNPKEQLLIQTFKNYFPNENRREYFNFLEQNNIDIDDDIIKNFIKQKMKKNDRHYKTFIKSDKCKSVIKEMKRIIKNCEDRFQSEIEQEAENKISAYIRFRQKKKKNPHLQWWKECSKKKIIDYDSKASFIFAEDTENHIEYLDNLIEREEQEEQEEIILYLYNKNKQKVGYMIEWTDKEEIPSKFKTKYKNVIHPENGRYLYKYVFFKNGMCYHNLKKPYYTEFKYCKREDVLKPTNEIFMYD